MLPWVMNDRKVVCSALAGSISLLSFYLFHSHISQPDYPNMARVVGRAYRYLAAEGVEEKIDLNPIAWKRVYVDSRKLLAVVQDVLVERTERKEWLCC